MKNKSSFVIIYWWLFLLLVAGILLLTFGEKKERMSEAENRMLSGFPELSAENILSGDFSADFENYLSDGVFGRDSIVGASELLIGKFSVNTEEDIVLLNEIAMKDELQGETPGEGEEITQTEAPSEKPDNIPAASETDSSAQTEDEDEEFTLDENAPVSDDIEGNGLFIERTDGGYLRVYYASVTNMKKVADVLNEYKSCLPKDGNVFYTNIPLTDTGVMLRNKNKYSGWYENIDEGIAPYLNKGVYYINTPKLLESDLRDMKAMYFKSDHHWTPEAAIHTVNECMRIQGVPTVPYNEYKYKIGVFENKAKGTSDDLEMLYPLQKVKGNLLPNGDVGKERVLVNYSYTTYVAYLSGDSEIWTMYNTGFSTGRNALVIGDSFSNAFTPYLMPYYDTVYKVDARYYVPEDNGGTISELMKKYGVDDVYIIVSYANGVRSKTSLEKLKKALYG